MRLAARTLLLSGRLVVVAAPFGHAAIKTTFRSCIQGLSDRFPGVLDHVPLPSAADGIDFEGRAAFRYDRRINS
jgi:hypothetical protein